MASGTLLTLLDDIASVLDDVATATKHATSKSAGVLGDDLALNAEQVSGVPSSRELPVVWAVAKGSAINKAILVPIALVLSLVASWAITPLLMVGGAYLCYEGFEKVLEKILPHQHEKEADTASRRTPEEIERHKIRGAIQTDFILSAEIVVITLGAVAGDRFIVQVLVLTGMATLMTVFVYGMVALIVRLDDIGLFLTQQSEPWKKRLGQGILAGAPYLMRGLGIVGTAAMFLVGGGIYVHGIEVLHHWEKSMGHGFWGFFGSMVLSGVVGIVVGAITVGAKMGVTHWRKSQAGPQDA